MKKANISLYMAFIIVAVLIVIIAAVFAPMGVMFNTKMYLAGEDILGYTQDDINSIQDDEIRASVNGSILAAKDAAENNITVNANIFQYSWVFIVLLSALVVFIYTRRLTEINRGFI